MFDWHVAMVTMLPVERQVFSAAGFQLAFTLTLAVMNTWLTAHLKFMESIFVVVINNIFQISVPCDVFSACLDKDRKNFTLLPCKDYSEMLARNTFLKLFTSFGNSSPFSFPCETIF